MKSSFLSCATVPGLSPLSGFSCVRCGAPASLSLCVPGLHTLHYCAHCYQSCGFREGVERLPAVSSPAPSSSSPQGSSREAVTVLNDLRQMFLGAFLILLLVLVMGFVGAMDHPVKETPWQGEALVMRQGTLPRHREGE